MELSLRHAEPIRFGIDELPHRTIHFRASRDIPEATTHTNPVGRRPEKSNP
jgi:hypothetical protein